MNMRSGRQALLAQGMSSFALAIVASSLALLGCFGTGPGSDFDGDGIVDILEDVDEDFVTDVGETSMADADTDGDGLCDGPVEDPLPECIRCEDCNANGIWEPCLGETNPTSSDSDGDGVPEARDETPLDGIISGCGDG